MPCSVARVHLVHLYLIIGRYPVSYSFLLLTVDLVAVCILILQVMLPGMLRVLLIFLTFGSRQPDWVLTVGAVSNVGLFVLCVSLSRTDPQNALFNKTELKFI